MKNNQVQWPEDELKERNQLRELFEKSKYIYWRKRVFQKKEIPQEAKTISKVSEQELIDDLSFINDQMDSDYDLAKKGEHHYRLSFERCFDFFYFGAGYYYTRKEMKAFLDGMKFIIDDKDKLLGAIHSQDNEERRVGRENRMKMYNECLEFPLEDGHFYKTRPIGPEYLTSQGERINKPYGESNGKVTP